MKPLAVLLGIFGLLMTLLVLSPGRPATAQARSGGSAPGRFVPMIPPAAGDKTYANFVWVLDTSTGEVTAYRLASISDDAGKVQAWVTEQLLTDSQYMKLQQTLGTKQP